MFLQCTLCLGRLLTLLALACLPSYAMAQVTPVATTTSGAVAPSLDPYIIKGVAASATAKDAVQARDQALASAQRQAFATMIKRLNRTDVKADKFDDQAIAGMVKSFSIDSERAAATAYRALVTVIFNQTKVAALLGGTGAVAAGTSTIDTTMGANFTGAKPRLLLLPILVVGQRRVLWDEPNPWLKAWQKLGAVQGQRAQFRVPVGDMDDIKTLPENALAAGRFDNVTPMLMRYAADRMVVAQITSQGAPTLANAGLNMQLYELRDNQFVPLAEQNVAASGGYQFADAVPVAVNLAEQALAGNAPAMVVNQPTSAVTAAAMANGQGSGQANGLPVMVRYDNLATWLRIQNQLKKMPQVYAVNVQKMSATEAKLSIGLKGDLPSFETALSEHGWALRLLGEGQYQLTKLGRTL